MSRKEVTEKLQSVMDEIDAVYKKHNCSGIFVVYAAGESGFTSDGYQNEGQGGVGTPFSADYSIVRKLADIAPDHPAVKEYPDVYVLALKPEEVSMDKEHLRAVVSPTINMARVVAFLSRQAAAMAADLAKNSMELAEELGIGAPDVVGVANSSTGEGMDKLPPEVNKNSMH